MSDTPIYDKTLADTESPDVLPIDIPAPEPATGTAPTYPWWTRVKPVAKAVAGFLAPGVAVLAVAVTDGSPGGSAVTTAELISALSAMLLTSGAVYLTPNKAPDSI